MLKRISPPLVGVVLLGWQAAAGCGSDDSSTGFGGASAAGDAAPAGSGGADAAGAPDGKETGPQQDASLKQEAGGTGGTGEDAATDVVAPCTTRLTYGSRWIHPDQHPAAWDEVSGHITWDGACVADGGNSYALLSNGWKPYFTGNGTCVIALDYQNCPGAPSACATRISYGPAWKAPPNHPESFDDVSGAVLWDAVCRNTGADSYANLSNGWAPHFAGNAACSLSFRYTECGGLYANAVVDTDCADPGVMRADGQYWVACTSGNGPNGFPLRVSSDLVHWSAKGHIFPSGSKPSWAKSDFWAPELHRVGSGYVAYFTARHQDGALSIGAATSSQPGGPYTDIGQPLLHQSSMGLIDATQFQASGGKRYLLWKEDGNAVGKPTPIHGQELSADGLSLVGTRKTLLTNDQGWEGTVVEAPWVVEHGGQFYLFYSGNGYYGAAYAVGVARASAPLGPYAKAPAPIVVTKGPWVGPGHNSIVTTPSGEDWMVYHAWKSGQVNGPGDGRVLLIDRVLWQGGWPATGHAPSSTSLPTP